ncbi:MAG: hypothetical protein QXF75_00910 [Candidatus Bathyarchaeia archaeon]
MTMLLTLLVYGVCIIYCKGKLANQTATLIDAEDTRIFSLMVNNTIISLSKAISINLSQLNVEPKDAKCHIIDGTLLIDCPINYSRRYIFNATLEGLSLNFSRFPYLHALISSSPDVSIDLLVGTLNNYAIFENELQPAHNIVIDDKYVWVNCSSKVDMGFDDHINHSVTLNIKEMLLKCALADKNFSAIEIKVKILGILKPEIEGRCLFRLASLSVMRELPYYLSQKVKAYCLSEGTAAYVIKENDDFRRSIVNYPYLQRAYVKYSINASKNALYTVFLVYKKKDGLVASRSDFLFIHTSRSNQIGTYIDWKKLKFLDLNFDPINGLHYLMEEGDYGIIFVPVNGSEIKSVTLHKVEFTFSKIQFDECTLPTLSEEVLLAATLFILMMAGILPTFLLIALFFMHRKGILNNDKTTITRILITGLAFRLVLAPITAYPYDLQIFAQLGALYYGSGILGAQWVSLPGFVYIQIAAYLPYALLRAAGFQDFQFLASSAYTLESFFVKIPSILADLGIVLYLQKISQKHVPKEQALLLSIYMLNPLTIYISAILGQFDTIFVFTIILSTYYLIVKYDKVKAGIFSGFCAIINPVGAATFVPLLAKIKKSDGFFPAFKTLLLAVGIFCILIVPFVFEPKSPIFITSFERFLSGIPGEAFYGKQFNFYLYGSIIPSSVGYGLTLRFMLEILGYELHPFFYPCGTLIAFLILIAIFLYRVNKANLAGLHEKMITGTFMLCTVAIFQLTFPTIFDQFVIWIAGLLLMAYLFSNEKYFLVTFAVISIATGFIYVAFWRNYLRFISGAERVAFGDPYLSNIMSALIGALYSVLLLIILILTIKLWLQKFSNFPLCTKCSNSAMKIPI